MIYCNLDPGLIVLNNLKLHQITDAKNVEKILSLHTHMINNHNIRIPMTSEYLIHILDSLNLLQIQERPLKILIRRLLGRTVSPPFPTSGIHDGIILPNIFQEWVDERTRLLWLDCLSWALFQEYNEGLDGQAQSENFVGTFPLDTPVKNIKLYSQELAQLTDNKTEWVLPILTTNIEWTGYIASKAKWPHGLQSSLIELYAYQNLGIALNDIKNYRSISFEAACLRDIENELDLKFQLSLIEVIACRAYDCIKPEHGDHKININTHRVYVNKMNPPARLHYYFDEKNIVYTMYENGDHNRGLT